MRFEVTIGGESREMCCAGCAAVASAIVDAGLDNYYARRDNYPESRFDALPEVAADLSLFDRPEIQAGFVTQESAEQSEAALILEGITCPACVWLNETHLARQPGIVAVRINYTTNRALVRWDTRLTSLSAILAAIRDIGYRAYPYDAQSLEAAQRREARGLLARFAIAGLGMLQVMMYALPGYLAEDGGIANELSSLMHWAALMLTLPVVLYSAFPFFSGAGRDLRAGRVGMDVPVALAIALAFSASVLATITAEGAVYFDSIVMFVFLLLGARYLELRARQKSASHLESLSRAVPATANFLPHFPNSMDTELVPAGALVEAQYVLVRPGETFPVDGQIEQGETEVDEALLTGESMPVRRLEGGRVVGGSVNRGNPVVVCVEQVGEHTMLSAIVKLMERAAYSRPRLQEITDRVAARFVAVVLILAACVTAWWLVLDASRALPILVSVLIVTCPCALALATPMAMAVATSSAGRRGLLITRSHALETLAQASHFVIDKTGTLTEGKVTLNEMRAFAISREESLALAGALEHGSEHPIASAIREAAASTRTAQQVRNVPGRGMEGIVDGRPYRIGTAHFAAELAGREEMPDDAFQTWLASDHEILAGFGFDDRLRPEAARFVTALRAQGIELVLLSGDHAASVGATATRLGIATWRAAMAPQDKVDYVKKLQEQGAIVAMIGDGVNDAPVLAQAQVSVAMMSGAALAQGAADMVLLSGRLSDVAAMVRYARRTRLIVRQNLAWAVSYNLVAIPLAMAGYVTPWMAAIGMSASSLLVVLNALRLTRSPRAHKLVVVPD
jgi:Cu2+-exporting ATPase